MDPEKWENYDIKQIFQLAHMMNLVDSFNLLLFWTQVIAYHLRNVLVFFSFHLLNEIIFIIFGHTMWCVGSLFASWGLNPDPLKWTCGVLPLDCQGIPICHFICTLHCMIWLICPFYQLSHAVSVLNGIFVYIFGQYISK